MTEEKLKSVSDAVEFVRSSLKVLEDPDRAIEMAAYMKTEMPFYGVPSPDRKVIFRDLKRRFPLADSETYRDLVSELWSQPHREEKYIALTVASEHRKLIAWEHIDLYEFLVRDGAWWDFVDHVTPHCIGRLFITNRDEATALMKTWNEDDDMWIRRSSIICQLKLKKKTDGELLFDMCRARMHETEFFIRKAIGWALREYAKTDPDSVIDFLETHRDDLSGLSFREGAKHLIKKGKIAK